MLGLKVEAVAAGNEAFDLKVDIKEKLFPAHPSWKSHHKRHADELHGVSSLVEASLLHLQVVLLTVLVTFQRETSHSFLKAVISDLPALVLIKFVHDADERGLSIRKEV